MSTVRPFKYHIINFFDDVPLTYDDKALEFDTKEAAERFVESLYDNGFYSVAYDAIIKGGILYYDGGYIDTTNYIIDRYGELKEV